MGGVRPLENEGAPRAGGGQRGEERGEEEEAAATLRNHRNRLGGNDRVGGSITKNFEAHSCVPLGPVSGAPGVGRLRAPGVPLEGPGAGGEGGGTVARGRSPLP